MVKSFGINLILFSILIFVFLITRVPVVPAIISVEQRIDPDKRLLVVGDSWADEIALSLGNKDELAFIEVGYFCVPGGGIEVVVSLLERSLQMKKAARLHDYDYVIFVFGLNDVIIPSDGKNRYDYLSTLLRLVNGHNSMILFVKQYWNNRIEGLTFPVKIKRWIVLNVLKRSEVSLDNIHEEIQSHSADVYWIEAPGNDFANNYNADGLHLSEKGLENLVEKIIRSIKQNEK